MYLTQERRRVRLEIIQNITNANDRTARVVLSLVSTGEVRIIADVSPARERDAPIGECHHHSHIDVEEGKCHHRFQEHCEVRDLGSVGEVLPRSTTLSQHRSCEVTFVRGLGHFLRTPGVDFAH